MPDNIEVATTHHRVTETQNLTWVFWLLPLVFIIHDTEELFTLPRWVANHQQELDQLSKLNETIAEMVRRLPSTTAQFALSIGFILLLFVSVTIGVCKTQKRGFWLYAYTALLGALFLHVFTHLGQAILIGGYVPGLIGAIAAIIPGSLYIYRRLFQANLLTWKSTILTALAGISLFLPGILFAHQVGKIIGSGWSR